MSLSIPFLMVVCPLAIYIATMIFFRLRNRPTFLYGSQDTFLLGFAIVGLVACGPMMAMVSLHTRSFYGNFLPLVFAVLFFLLLFTLQPLRRPFFVFYNISETVLQQWLENWLPEVDPKFQRAGNCVVLPSLEIELILHYNKRTRTALFVATTRRQSLENWNRLSREAKLHFFSYRLQKGC